MEIRSKRDNLELLLVDFCDNIQRGDKFLKGEFYKLSLNYG